MLCAVGGRVGGSRFVLHRSFHPWDHCLHMDISGSPAAELVRAKMRILTITGSFCPKRSWSWGVESGKLLLQLPVLI